MSDDDYESDSRQHTNAQRFAQRARQNDICLALRAAAQLFVIANNPSFPHLSLECIDSHCDYASAFIGNIWQERERERERREREGLIELGELSVPLPAEGARRHGAQRERERRERERERGGGLGGAPDVGLVERARVRGRQRPPAVAKRARVEGCQAGEELRAHLGVVGVGARHLIQVKTIIRMIVYNGQ